MTATSIQVRYIGGKSKCTDSFPGGSVHTWFGAGDVQTLPATALSKIVQHPTVWEVVADDPAVPSPLESAAQPAEPAVVDAWLTKTAAELHAYAEQRGIRLDKRLKDADKIRAAIDAATAG